MDIKKRIEEALQIFPEAKSLVETVNESYTCGSGYTKILHQRKIIDINVKEEYAYKICALKIQETNFFTEICPATEDTDIGKLVYVKIIYASKDNISQIKAEDTKYYTIRKLFKDEREEIDRTPNIRGQLFEQILGKTVLTHNYKFV
ncbi:MAG: hypothetical protein KKF89_02780 [Nanoarchaeota archaeon]|nr:hypothetical protein [Nanoarchaeota archaeon]